MVNLLTCADCASQAAEDAQSAMEEALTAGREEVQKVRCSTKGCNILQGAVRGLFTAVHRLFKVRCCSTHSGISTSLAAGAAPVQVKAQYDSLLEEMATASRKRERWQEQQAAAERELAADREQFEAFARKQVGRGGELLALRGIETPLELLVSDVCRLFSSALLCPSVTTAESPVSPFWLHTFTAAPAAGG